METVKTRNKLLEQWAPPMTGGVRAAHAGVHLGQLRAHEREVAREGRAEVGQPPREALRGRRGGVLRVVGPLHALRASGYMRVTAFTNAYIAMRALRALEYAYDRVGEGHIAPSTLTHTHTLTHPHTRTQNRHNTQNFVSKHTLYLA